MNNICKRIVVFGSKFNDENEFIEFLKELKGKRSYFNFTKSIDGEKILKENDILLLLFDKKIYGYCSFVKEKDIVDKEFKKRVYISNMVILSSPYPYHYYSDIFESESYSRSGMYINNHFTTDMLNSIFLEKSKAKKKLYTKTGKTFSQRKTNIGSSEVMDKLNDGRKLSGDSAEKESIDYFKIKGFNVIDTSKVTKLNDKECYADILLNDLYHIEIKNANNGSIFLSYSQIIYLKDKLTHLLLVNPNEPDYKFLLLNSDKFLNEIELFCNKCDVLMNEFSNSIEITELEIYLFKYEDCFINITNLSKTDIELLLK